MPIKPFQDYNWNQPGTLGSAMSDAFDFSKRVWNKGKALGDPPEPPQDIVYPQATGLAGALYGTTQNQIGAQARQSFNAPPAPTLPVSPSIEKLSDVVSTGSMARTMASTPEPADRTLGPIGGRPLWSNTASVTSGDGTRRNLDVGGGFSAPVNMTPIEYQKATGRDMESGQWDMLARELLNQSANTYGNPNKADNLANLANIASRMSSRGEYGISMANIGERARQNLANEGMQQAQVNKWEADTDIARQKAPAEIEHLTSQAEKNRALASPTYTRRTMADQAALEKYKANLKAITDIATPPEVMAEARNQVQAFEQSLAGTGTSQEQPPMPGAQKAPDGRWYIQKDGKWFLLK